MKAGIYNYNKLFFIFILTIIVISFISPPVSSFFPVTHASNIKNLCSKNYNSDLSRMCCKNQPACMAGSMLADISVLYYLEKNFKKYTVTHSDLFCEQAIKESRNEIEEAIASGICLHHPDDRISHNILVPYSIEKTGIPNLLIHPFAEQKLDNFVLSNDPSAQKLVDDAMANVDQYSDFIQRVLQPNKEYGDIEVKKLIEGFIQQVKNSNSGYDVSFNTIKAVPISIYVWVISIFLFSILGIFLLLKFTRITISTTITFIIFLLIILFILALVIMTFTGTLWKFFVIFAKPISVFVPTPDLSSIIAQAGDMEKALFTYGIDYSKNLPDSLRDITGVNTGGIMLAEQHTSNIRWIWLGIIVFIIIVLLVFDLLSLKRRKPQSFSL